MKRFNLIFILAIFFLMASGGAAVQASSSDKGKHHTKSGHGMFNKHFAEMDTDGNGSLSFEEFQKIFPSTKQKAFNGLDSDKDGVLSQAEWRQFKEMHKDMGKYHGKKYHSEKLPDPGKFNAHFPDMDTDGNGKVTFEEFKAHFPDAPDQEAAFNAIDLDGKGDLDHDEWHEFKAAHGLKHVD